MKERVIITGASGHIGYHIARQLLELGFKPLLLVRGENANIERLRSAGADVVMAELTNDHGLQNLLHNADVLFHLASENTIETGDEERIVKNTFGLAKAVIDSAIAANVKTIIYTSSVVVLGRSKDPSVLLDESNRNACAETPYVKGKMLAEDYCNALVQQAKVDIRVIYPSWVIGPDDQKLTPPNRLIQEYRRKGQWFYFKGGVSITGVHAVAKCHINAWIAGRPAGKYIVAGHNITFKELYTRLAACTNHLKPFIKVPKWLMVVAAVIAKIFKIKGLPGPAYVKAVLGRYSWYSSTKAAEDLGYALPDLDTLLSEAMADLKTI